MSNPLSDTERKSWVAKAAKWLLQSGDASSRFSAINMASECVKNPELQKSLDGLMANEEPESSIWTMSPSLRAALEAVEQKTSVEMIANWLLKEGAADSKEEAMSAAEMCAKDADFVKTIRTLEDARAEVVRLEGRKSDE
jgi:hypothetical protein